MNIRLSKSALYNTTRMMVGTAKATHTASVLIYTHNHKRERPMARMTCNYWLSSTECETLATYLNDIESGLMRLGKARYALSSSEKGSLFNMEQSCTEIGRAHV